MVSRQYTEGAQHVGSIVQGLIGAATAHQRHPSTEHDQAHGSRWGETVIHADSQGAISESVTVEVGPGHLIRILRVIPPGQDLGEDLVEVLTAIREVLQHLGRRLLRQHLDHRGLKTEESSQAPQRAACPAGVLPTSGELRQSDLRFDLYSIPGLVVLAQPVQDLATETGQDPQSPRVLLAVELPAHPVGQQATAERCRRHSKNLTLLTRTVGGRLHHVGTSLQEDIACPGRDADVLSEHTVQDAQAPRSARLLGLDTLFGLRECCIDRGPMLRHPAPLTQATVGLLGDGAFEVGHPPDLAARGIEVAFAEPTDESTHWCPPGNPRQARIPGGGVLRR